MRRDLRLNFEAQRLKVDLRNRDSRFKKASSFTGDENEMEVARC